MEKKPRKEICAIKARHRNTGTYLLSSFLLNLPTKELCLREEEKEGTIIADISSST